MKLEELEKAPDEVPGRGGMSDVKELWPAGVAVRDGQVVVAVDVEEVCSDLLEDPGWRRLTFHWLLHLAGPVQLALRAGLDGGADV